MRESDLRDMVVRNVQEIKQRFPGWEDLIQLAKDLDIRVVSGSLGSSKEGAAFQDVIITDPSIRSEERRVFTFYHEITHHLIRRNDELLSVIHDQCRTDEDYHRVNEWLCNTGAAEFLMPREMVLERIRRTGFSSLLISGLYVTTRASRTAICVQLALCAIHRCIAMVCRVFPQVGDSGLFGQLASVTTLRVDTAVSSESMRYSVAHGTAISKDHLLWHSYRANDGRLCSGRASIPFRSGSIWSVDCEALRVGEQLFAIFNVDSPPRFNPDQMSLPF